MKKAILEDIKALIESRLEQDSNSIIYTSELEQFHPHDIAITMSILASNCKLFEVCEVGAIEDGVLKPLQYFSRNVDYYRIRALPKTIETVNDSRGIRLFYDGKGGIYFEKDGIRFNFRTLYAKDSGEKGIQEQFFAYLYNNPQKVVSVDEIIAYNKSMKDGRFNQYIQSIFKTKENPWIEKFFPYLDNKNGFIFTPFVSACEFEDYDKIQITNQTKRALQKKCRF